MGPPAGLAGLPPASLGVRTERSLLIREGGRVLIGGAPLRLMRLRRAGRSVVFEWRGGGPVGAEPARRALARRLLDTGTLVSDPEPIDAADVAIVVPVHDRVAAFARCLAALAADRHRGEIVVVDDGSIEVERVRAIAVAHGARLVRHPQPRGPSAARNTGLRSTDARFVAFVDSDVVVESRWLRRLRGHFEDPSTGAAAPRVLALHEGASPVARYEQRRSSLDMGGTAASVGVARSVSYVPSTAIVVRRDAMPAGAFDEALVVGEDVDLVWRMAADGWRIAYDPAVRVRHEHRLQTASFIRRRWDYAASIGLLARRHPQALPALRLDQATALALSLMLVRRRETAAAVAAVNILRLRQSLVGHCDRPTLLAIELTGRSAAGAVHGIGHAVRRVWSPPLLAAAVVGPRRQAARAVLVAALTLSALENRPRTPGEAAVAVADDAIAALGTWAGCWRARTATPLLPRIVRRSRRAA